MAGAAGKKASIEACVASGRISNWARPRDARSRRIASVGATTSSRPPWIRETGTRRRAIVETGAN